MLPVVVRTPCAGVGLSVVLAGGQTCQERAQSNRTPPVATTMKRVWDAQSIDDGVTEKKRGRAAG
jgi:hypothetical protein